MTTLFIDISHFIALMSASEILIGSKG